MSAVLLLTHRLPYPPDQGDKIRAFHLLKHLATTDDVYLGCFIDDPKDKQYLPHIAPYVKGHCCLSIERHMFNLRSLSALSRGIPLSVSYYAHKGMQVWVKNLIKRHQIKKIVVYSTAMAQYILPLIKQELNIIVDFVYVESDKWRQYADDYNLLIRYLYRLEAAKLQAYEKRVARAATSSVFVTQKEAAIFKQLTRIKPSRVHTIENGVDADYYDPALVGNSPYEAGTLNIVFTGAMDYKPNIDAVCWYAKKILPSVRHLGADVKFYIVGSDPDPSVCALEQLPGVVVTGYVPDIRLYIKHAQLVVAPLLIGHGLQNKVLEALSLGKPVIGSSAALSSITPAFTPLCAMANTEDEFIALTYEFLGQSIDTELASQQHQLVREHYDWHRNISSFASLLLKAPRARKQKLSLPPQREG